MDQDSELLLLRLLHPHLLHPHALIGLYLDEGEAAIAAAYLRLVAIMADLGGEAAACEVVGVAV